MFESCGLSGEGPHGLAGGPHSAAQPRPSFDRGSPPASEVPSPIAAEDSVKSDREISHESNLSDDMVLPVLTQYCRSNIIRYLEVFYTAFNSSLDIFMLFLCASEFV